VRRHFAPSDVTSQLSRVASGITVTQVSNVQSNWNTYADIPAFSAPARILTYMQHVAAIVQQANTLASPVRILFAGVPAQIVFAGLAASFVGLHQFNVVVPEVADGDAVPLTIAVGSAVGAQTLFLAVGN